MLPSGLAGSALEPPPPTRLPPLKPPRPLEPRERGQKGALERGPDEPPDEQPGLLGQVNSFIESPLRADESGGPASTWLYYYSRKNSESHRLIE